MASAAICPAPAPVPRRSTPPGPGVNGMELWVSSRRAAWSAGRTISPLNGSSRAAAERGQLGPVEAAGDREQNVPYCPVLVIR